jgi:hypothetical protein
MDEKKFKCEICGAKLNYLEWANHLSRRNIADNPNSFSCIVCRKGHLETLFEEMINKGKIKSHEINNTEEN